MEPRRDSGPARGPGLACAVCGAPARPPFRAPRPELAPDLDLRPGEPARSTLPRWIATCPRCGACAPDLADMPAGAAGTVRSDPYRTLTGPPGTLPFLRWAMICEAAGEREMAAEAVLQAAWVLDDAGAGARGGPGADAEADAGADAAGDAAALRRRAAGLWDRTDSGEARLRRVDALRRAGAFAEAAAEAQRLRERQPDETTARLLDFQLNRIGAADTGRHLLGSALRPPARMPHVAQNQGAAGNATPRRAGPRGGVWLERLWARLRGG